MGGENREAIPWGAGRRDSGGRNRISNDRKAPWTRASACLDIASSLWLSARACGSGLLSPKRALAERRRRFARFTFSRGALASVNSKEAIAAAETLPTWAAAA